MSDFVRKSDVLDLLYGIFDKYKMSTDKNISIGKSFGTDVFEEIRNMPTAYSVEKVIAKLEEAKHTICLSDDDLEHYQNGIDRAIEIVKNGCASYDVCEWEQQEDGYRNCRYSFDEIDSVDFFRYCPYCGKKIKVKE